MGGEIKRVYLGPNKIISSLGVSTAENYACIDSYSTKISKYNDSTQACLIDRDRLDTIDLSVYTFAEQISIIALTDVMDQSEIVLDNPRTVLILSTTKGNIECVHTDFERSYLWSISSKIAAYFACYNKPMIVSNACISGVAAIVIGSRLIEEGTYDHVYVLGVDVISEFIVSGFNSFKSISPTVCRPYDASRDGLTIGEGCGVVLLTADRAVSESKIVVSGGSLSDDANHISGPSRTGDGLFCAIDVAMKQANIIAQEVDYINMHGTGTSFNDEMESKALNEATLTNTPCNSLKPYIGHTFGASGVIETILTAEQMRNNHIFGVKGYANNGVPFELNVSAIHRNKELLHVLKTASGFGGTNAAIVLSKESVLKQQTKLASRTQIVEIAHVEINPQADKPFAEYIRSEYKTLGEPNLKFFKMDNLSKLGYIASCKLMAGITLPYTAHRVGIVLSNRSSSLNTDLKHQAMVDQHLPEGTSPAIFVYTLANIVAAEIAIKHKIKGEVSFFINEYKNMDFLSNYSHKLIENNICDAVIYGWCELLKEDYNTELKLIKRV